MLVELIYGNNLLSFDPGNIIHVLLKWNYTPGYFPWVEKKKQTIFLQSSQISFCSKKSYFLQ